MRIKKIALGLCSLLMATTFVACGSNENQEGSVVASTNESGQEAIVEEETMDKKDLVVFAAASMTDVLEEIKTAYEEENPETNLVFNFDSSGTLKSQILEGADVDVFISAAQKQMNELDPSDESYNGEVSIVEDSRIDLLENKVTLVVPEGNEKKIEKFEDLNTDKVETIALGNEDVPVGQYSEEILRNLGIYDQIQEKVTLGSNVREVASWVKEGTVDTGIIYATDAKAFDLEVVSQADDSILDNKVIYPAAVLENSENKDQAQDFLDFLETDRASKVLEDAGFTPFK